MKFSSQSQHRMKPKLLTLLLSLLLVVSMLVPMIQYNTLEVYAEGNTTGGDNSASPENTTAGAGVHWGYTGWLVYISDVNGNLCSPVALVLKSTPPASYSQHWCTQIGGASPSGVVNIANYPGWPLPVSSSGSNWRELKSYMEANSAQVVQGIFGDGILNTVNANLENYYLVCETVSWHGVPGRSTNGIGNHYGWVKLWESGGASPNGKGFYPYNKIAISEMIETQWPGLPAPPTYMPSSDTECIALATLLQGGYGMAAFRLKPSAGQTTADEPLIPTPHDPPDESVGIKTIIKNYRTVNDDTNVVTDDGCTHRDNVDPKITIEEEGEYKVVGWKTSNTKDYGLDSITWPVPGRITQQGSTSGSTVLNSPIETVLYVLLEKHENIPGGVTGTADFILSESTISRKIQLSKPDNSGIKLINTHEFTWTRPAHKTTCSGHIYHWQSSYTDGNGVTHTTDHYDTHHCSFGRWNDNTMGQSLNNTQKSSFPDIVATKQLGVVSKTTGLSDNTKGSYTVTVSNTGADTQKRSGWDYRCVIMRGKDKLTVAQWKNANLGAAQANSYLSGLSSSGFTVANSDSGTRKTSLYYDSFDTSFRWDHSNKSTIYSSNGACGHGHQCGPNTRTYSLQNPLDIHVGVKVETYSGTVSSTQNDTSYNDSPTSWGIFGGMPVLSGLNKVQGVEVNSGPQLSFRPYIQMNYDTLAQNHAKYGAANSGANFKAYVLGEIDRTMTPNDYAEVSWKERAWDKPNLTLNSLQWSTHASAVDFIQNKLGADVTKWTVLPGGATLDLTIKDTDRQKVVATTYQCIVEGTGKTQIDNAGGSYSGLEASNADSAHQAYVNTLVDAIEKLNVEQWVTDDLSGVNGSSLGTQSANVWEKSNSSSVLWGLPLGCAGHPNQTASLEYKYYFSEDGERPEAPASEGDLDVEIKNTTSRKFTFYTNTFGEVYMIEDDPSGNQSNERAGTKLTPGGLSGIAKQINDRTHVVDKLYKAVEHGTGKDASGRSKTGTTWYNEAFDGITVYVQCTELSVGYLQPPQRSTVLDPKLTQTQDSHSDMFNKDKYNMSQYRTKNYSNAYPNNEEKVGEFKGASVYMKDMPFFFFSKQFFIPNATVDDLH